LKVRTGALVSKTQNVAANTITAAGSIKSSLTLLRKLSNHIDPDARKLLAK